tara:strand:+ start:1719 stop:2264 length:546 start_codon:yes stop_codon:yes gene_type:complete
MIEYEKKIAQQTLDILKKKSWSALSLDQALKNNKNKHIDINSKFDLLKNINRYVDNMLIKKIRSIENSSTKDMLFEVLMARFDILQLNRKSFLEIYKVFKKKPQYFIKLLPSFLESMIVTAELSKYNVNGLKGTIRLKGLMLVYFVTFFQWMDDKNSSLEKTMTALDKNLDQSEKFVKLFL